MSKQKSVHHQLVEFFSDTALRARGFRPKITPADAMRLKQVLKEDILDQSHWEQVILFFLADRNYKKLSPSIATMLSSTILNGLRNQALNGEQFYKELEMYRYRYVKQEEGKHEEIQPKEQGMKPVQGMLAEKLKALSEKMAMRPKWKPKAVPAKAPRAGPVGLFG
jgi:hypothetical protein